MVMKALFNKNVIIALVVLFIFMFGGGSFLFANPALLIFGGLILVLVMRQ